MERVPPELRLFTKEHAGSARSELAEDIRVERRGGQERKKTVQQEISEIVERVELGQLEVGSVIVDIHRLQATIEQKRGDMVQRILEFFEIRKLQARLRERQTVHEMKEQEIGDLQERLEKLRQSDQESSNLETVKGRLTAFYQDQSEAWREFEDEERACSVAEISRSRDVRFVHAISPNFTPDGNSLLREGVDWETKLKILLALEPSVSASSIKPGDTKDKMWAAMGVILSGGSIENAYTGDSGTVATSLGGRVDPTGKRGRPSDIRERIGIAIDRGAEGRFHTGYNEFIVRRPEVAGLYVSIDETPDRIDTNIVPDRELARVAKERNLPLYILEGGIAYESTFDENSRRLVRGAPVDYNKLCDQSPRLGEMDRSAMQGELFDDSPFKLKSPEHSFLKSRENGRVAYLELAREGLIGSPLVFHQAELGSPYNIPEGADIEELETIRGLDARRTYYRYQGRVFERSQGRKKQEASWSEVVDAPQSLSRSIQLGSGMADSVKIDIHSVDDYLQGMEERLRTVQTEAGSITENPAWPKQSEFYRNWVAELAYHIHGFADQAERSGDAAASQRARTIAETYIQKADVEEVVKRRIDSQGHLKITRSDIE